MKRPIWEIVLTWWKKDKGLRFITSREVMAALWTCARKLRTAESLSFKNGDEIYRLKQSRTRTASNLRRTRKEIRLRDKLIAVYERRDSCSNDPDIEDWCAEIYAARAALAELDKEKKCQSGQR